MARPRRLPQPRPGGECQSRYFYTNCLRSRSRKSFLSSFSDPVFMLVRPWGFLSYFMGCGV